MNSDVRNGIQSIFPFPSVECQLHCSTFHGEIFLLPLCWGNRFELEFEDWKVLLQLPSERMHCWCMHIEFLGRWAACIKNSNLWALNCNEKMKNAFVGLRMLDQLSSLPLWALFFYLKIEFKRIFEFDCSYGYIRVCFFNSNLKWIRRKSHWKILVTWRM